MHFRFSSVLVIAAMTAPLLSAAGVQAASQGCQPVMLSGRAEGPDLCYGPEAWREPTLQGKVLNQSFDFYRANVTTGAPLVIWAHPNGASKTLPKSSAMYKALVQPALEAGFSFASIEFRHPVANENAGPGGRVPHHDLARALQFMRANAGALGIDPDNVFLAGQSRGTLALWTALQDDMADPHSADLVARQSTRVNAVFGVNAQTTYDGSEFADLFIVPRDRPIVANDFEARHPLHAQFGSAIRSVNASGQADPPVKLRYDSMPVPKLLTLEEMAQVDTVHYPNFGLALCSAYVAAFRDLKRCSVEFNTAYEGNPQAAFAGYVGFFKQHLKASLRTAPP